MSESETLLECEGKAADEDACVCEGGVSPDALQCSECESYKTSTDARHGKTKKTSVSLTESNSNSSTECNNVSEVKTASQYDVTTSPTINVYRRRWYVLFVYSAFSFLQGALVDVYAVVAVSCEKALQWNDSEISIMQNWIYVCYLLAVFPSCLLIDVKG